MRYLNAKASPLPLPVKLDETSATPYAYDVSLSYFHESEALEEDDEDEAILEDEEEGSYEDTDEEGNSDEVNGSGEEEEKEEEKE